MTTQQGRSASDDPLDLADDATRATTLVFDERAARHGWAEDVLGMLTGSFSASFGLALLHEVDAVTGGTAGLSLLVGYATAWPFWLVFAAVNLPFAVLAVWKKGWSFTIRTAIAIALVSVFSVVIDASLRIDSVQPVFAVLAGNVFAGVGLLILFRHRASLGGVNIIALVVQERTGFRAGWTQLAFDVVIIALALTVVPWWLVLLSGAGAVILNVTLALNHRPGRYIGH